MRSIYLLGVQVAVEGKGWMVLAIDNYDYGYSVTGNNMFVNAVWLTT